MLSFGESLAPIAPEASRRRPRAAATWPAALAAVRDRFRGRAVAGIVARLRRRRYERCGGAASPPTVRRSFPSRSGSDTAGRDREVLSVTAAEAVLDDSRVELAASVVGHGHGTAPIVMRLLENGRPIDVRQAAPAAEGVPVRATFRSRRHAALRPSTRSRSRPPPASSFPKTTLAACWSQPPSRPRRVLLVEGAPGFEHSFLKRALGTDSGLEVDSVVRKGRNEQGADTFYVQAARSRSEALAAGYPQKTEDAVPLRRTRARQRRGYAAAGAHSSTPHATSSAGAAADCWCSARIRSCVAVSSTRRSKRCCRWSLPAAVAATSHRPASRGVNRVSLTAAGEAHPVMQLGAAADETRKRWEAAPALASIAPLGDPRPGASVLAVTTGRRRRAEGAGGGPALRRRTLDDLCR